MPVCVKDVITAARVCLDYDVATCASCPFFGMSNCGSNLVAYLNFLVDEDIKCSFDLEHCFINPPQEYIEKFL